ncbi:Protein slowmo-like protein, partial [Cucurbita argyrosperma subsp. sororia]
MQTRPENGSFGDWITHYSSMSPSSAAMAMGNFVRKLHLYLTTPRSYGNDLDLSEPPSSAACEPRLLSSLRISENSVMVKAYAQEYTYEHPWERVTSASWRKFVDSENRRTLSHILEVDTLNRKVDIESGKLYTTRAITIHAPGPWFVRKIVGQDTCHCVESTVVDARSRSMQLTTQNISFQKFIEVVEKIRYEPHPDNPNGWTMCRQETSIRIKPLSALASMAEKVEQRCAERFMQNSVKGREVMERICKYLEAGSSGLTV